MPAASVDFTTFTWPAILRRLRQMHITGALLSVTQLSLTAAQKPLILRLSVKMFLYFTQHIAI